MISLAVGIGESVVEFERSVAGRDIKPAGSLRVTTIDSLAIYVLPPMLNLFRQEYPNVELDLILSTQDVSLSRRDAEVALRATSGPTGGLVGERSARSAGRSIARPSLRIATATTSFPPRPGSVRATITGRGAAGAGSRNMSRGSVRFAGWTACSSMAELATVGLGAAILPCFIGDARSGLVRVGAPGA